MYDFFSLTSEEKEQIVAKFNDRVDKNGPNGCWIWKGAKGRYGLLYSSRDPHFKISSHRIAWIIKYNVPIPEGLYACHSCDVRLCCRPEHIFIGTAKHNTHDAIRKGRFGNRFTKKEPKKT